MRFCTDYRQKKTILRILVYVYYKRNTTTVNRLSQKTYTQIFCKKKSYKQIREFEKSN